MPLTARIPVRWLKRRSTGVVDGRGAVTHEFAPAITVLVFAVDPTGSAESSEIGQRNRVITTVNLLAPVTLTEVGTERTFITAEEVSAFDRFEFGSRTYEVDGDVTDLTLGPFGYRPGVVVALKKVSA